jgi:hypothetical protein
MTATSKKKQAQYDKRRHKKIKMKRSLDKTFDKEYKQKQALKQRKRRNKLKQQQPNTLTATLPPVSISTTTKSDLRKKERRSTKKKIKYSKIEERKCQST